ncbi:MAG TPA: methyltransferase [Burkholderiaceae bacterium]
MAGAPTFSTRDPLAPRFWDERFEQGFTPWDRAGVPQQLQAYARSQPRPLTTLIPGCGAAYEAVFLLEQGWDVAAIDFSPQAVQAARAQAGKWADRIVQADFFAYEPAAPLDLIYERAFLCALPRSMWQQVAARWADLLAPGALLAGYFYEGDTVKGPPFGAAPREIAALLAGAFALECDDPVTDSIAVFAGKERWQCWRRLP